MTDMLVTLLDHMGSDLTIANAARVSFHKANDNLDPERDPKLISYLADHDHWSPFAHCFLQFRIKAPIFVARQLVKHQVGLAWNEVSRRYVSEEPEFYIPHQLRGKPTDGAKQGSCGELEGNENLDALMEFSGSIAVARQVYNRLLNEHSVAPEMARMVLPQNMMTEWIWSGSLYAFSRVCNLRLDHHSQSETTQIARQISDEAQPLFPYAWAALLSTEEADAA